MNINLHINRLVLDGVDLAPGQSSLLQKSIVSQLTQLLEVSGLASNLTAGTAVKQLSTNSRNLNNTQPTDLGQQIARSIYRGIGNE